MGIEFSCCSAAVPSLPLPPRPTYSSAPPSEGSGQSIDEGYEEEFPQVSMGKSCVDSKGEGKEFRALSRMYSSRKHRPTGGRRVCSFIGNNPFEVTQSSIERSSDGCSMDFSIPVSEHHSKAPSLSDFPAPPSLRPVYDFHSPPKWFKDESELISLVSISDDSPRFKAIVDRIHKTLDIPVIKVEKVRNLPLYRGFADTHEDHSRAEGNTHQILELFYGTGRVDPYTVCTNFYGLDSPSIQVFNQPMTCFADTAKDSFKFSYRRKDGSRQLLLCLVTVGEPVTLLPDEDVYEPPARLDRSTPVLSAKLQKKKGNIWIVYEKKMSYPGYIITLKEPDPKAKAI